MAVVQGAHTHHMVQQFLLWAKTVFDWAAIDKMAPRRVKSAPGVIELNKHFGAETDLLDLECTLGKCVKIPDFLYNRIT